MSAAIADLEELNDSLPAATPPDRCVNERKRPRRTTPSSTLGDVSAPVFPAVWITTSDTPNGLWTSWKRTIRLYPLWAVHTCVRCHPSLVAFKVGHLPYSPSLYLSCFIMFTWHFASCSLVLQSSHGWWLTLCVKNFTHRIVQFVHMDYGTVVISVSLIKSNGEMVTRWYGYNFYYDNGGRFIRVDVSIDNCEFRLVSIYAPNLAPDIRDFFNLSQHT